MLYPLFLLLIFLSKSNLSKSEADLRSAVISALEKATYFMENTYRDINLDAVVGFRILQAHLEGALEEWASEHELLSQQARVESLVRKLSSLIEKAMHSLEQNDLEYFKEFEPILGPDFWILPHSWNQTDSTLAYPEFGDPDCFNEEISDSCFTYLLGTWKDKGKPCIVTNACRNIMTKFGCSDYSLSHQLFYFMLADMKGCSNHLFLRAQYYKNIFCASMMKINMEIESNGIKYLSQDLFMENIMFCGMSGFSDFYKPHWLEAILSWQRPEKGCFGKPSNDFEHARGTDQNQQLRRVKRREKMLADGCSSHNTAVAVGALGGFLYYY